MAQTDPNTENLETRQRYRRSLDAILARLPAALAQGLRLAAIPRWFDAPLLARLSHAAPAQVAPLIEALLEFPFIRPEEGSPSPLDAGRPSGEEPRYRFQGEIRLLLLEDWRREQTQAYLQANHTALAYFDERAAAANFVAQPALQREGLYHLLAVDETAGIERLAVLFEDAFDRRQFGACQDLLGAAEEQRDLISLLGRAYLSYYAARLDQVYHGADPVRAVYEDLAESIPEARLQAMARWSLGEILLSENQWSAAIQAYRESLARLPDKPPDLYTARVLRAVGDAYLDLAEKSGGAQAGDLRTQAPARRIQGAFAFFLELPFRLYEALLRRVDCLPSDWYFGANYQDWITAYLLMQSSRWRRRALASFQGGGDRRGAAETRLALAEVELAKGRWSRAAKAFERLLADENILDSLYRTARVQLGQGELLLKQGRPAQAIPILEQAIGIFQRFQDPPRAAQAQRLLSGAALLLARQPRQNRSPASLEEAAQAALESFETYAKLGDRLHQTQLAWDLEALWRSAAISEATRRRIAEALESEPERQYLARFPGDLLRRFRRMALFGALPLTAIFILLTGVGIFMFLSIGESTFLQGVAGLRPVDLLTLALGATLPLPVALWGYRGIYSLIGIALVRLLGRRLVPIEREQPDLVATLPEALSIRRQTRDASQNLPWVEVGQAASLDYSLSRRTSARTPVIQLFSSLWLGSSSGGIVVEGITSGYTHLREDISRRIKAALPVQTAPVAEAASGGWMNLDFAVLDYRWALAAVLAAFIYALILVQQEIIIATAGPVPQNGQPGTSADLPLASIFLVAYLLTFFYLPAVTSWRLVRHALKQRRQLKRPAGAAVWLLLAFAVLSTLLAAAFSLSWLFIQ